MKWKSAIAIVLAIAFLCGCEYDGAGCVSTGDPPIIDESPTAFSSATPAPTVAFEEMHVPGYFGSTSYRLTAENIEGTYRIVYGIPGMFHYDSPGGESIEYDIWGALYVRIQPPQKEQEQIIDELTTLFGSNKIGGILLEIAAEPDECQQYLDNMVEKYVLEHYDVYSAADFGYSVIISGEDHE